MVIKIITIHAGTIESSLGTICCLSIGWWPKLFQAHSIVRKKCFTVSTLWRININLRYKLSKKNGLLRMYVVQFKEGNIICVVSCDRRHRSLGSSHPSFLLSPSRASEGRGSLTLQSFLITPSWVEEVRTRIYTCSGYVFVYWAEKVAVWAVTSYTGCAASLCCITWRSYGQHRDRGEERRHITHHKLYTFLAISALARLIRV